MALATRRAALCGTLAIGVSLALAQPAAAQLGEMTIIAPAAPGGGWDQTARSMQSALQDAGIAGNVEVVNVPGAGGAIGLAQFASDSEGDPSTLLVNGLVMVGALLTNDSPVTLDQVTPLARLTGEYEVIVVPGSSPIHSMTDLLEQFRSDPGSVAWAGGSAGGTDHILVALIAKEAGIDPAGINYVPFSGGGEALAALLANDVTAGVSGISEFSGQIDSGDLRAIAISSPDRLPGLDIPTLREQGVPVDLVNWRGVMAAPGLSDEQKQTLDDAIGRMVASDSWKKTLADHGWMDLYLPADQFAEFLANDSQRVEQVLKDVGLIAQ